MVKKNLKNNLFQHARILFTNLDSLQSAKENIPYYISSVHLGGGVKGCWRGLRGKEMPRFVAEKQQIQI